MARPCEHPNLKKCFIGNLASYRGTFASNFKLLNFFNEIDVFCLRELPYVNTRNHLFSVVYVQKTRLATTITMS